MDTPITIKQTQELISWIKAIAPKRKLCYIYITHGHGDHWFGIPTLVEQFPEATPIATPGTVRHMEETAEARVFEENWASRFPGQIHPPTTLAQPIPESWNHQFKLEDRWTFQAVECGHSDTYDSTILWVPDIKLAICGDVVYGQVHQMLMIANTKAKREEWIRAIETVEALGPAYVVPGHKQAEEIDGVWHLESTKKYIMDFGRVLQTEPETEKEVMARMLELYPDRFNPGALFMSAMGVFKAPKHARI